MARMYPKAPDSGTPPSEARVFGLCESELPKTWRVFHSAKFVETGRTGQPPTEGELDFAIIDPSRGLLGLEVKGGGVGRDDGGWYSIDGTGSRHTIKDPAAQAQRATHTIAELLNRGVDRMSGARVRFVWGVALPDVRVSEGLAPNLPRGLLIDRDDLANFKNSIDRVFGATQITGQALSEADLARITMRLAPSFHLVPTLSSRVADDELELVRLTGEQIALLDGLAEMPRVAVKGAAGTGKTIVAMEKARRLAAGGKRVLLLCFNRLLGDHLAERADGFTARAFHAFCREVVISAGLRFNPPRDPAAQAEFWDSKASELLLTALDTYPDERWDAVVVDEAQDFKELWWIAVQKLLRDPDHGLLWAFHDPNQDIFGGGVAESLGLQPFTLRWNCRNTVRIARHCASLIESNAVTKPSAPEGVQVVVHDCSDDGAMVDCVRRELHRLVTEEGLKNDQIVVLTAHGAANSKVRAAGRMGNLTFVDFPARPGPNEVVFSTLQRFKGLESDVVILCEVGDDDATSSARHLYVGCSRAKHVLIVARYA